MAKLYSTLSSIYEIMYQSLINYDDEFALYYTMLLPFKPFSLVEIGCGTGHLAGRFSKSEIGYLGMDLSPEMLLIAKNNNPDCKFILEDMRNFKLAKKPDAFIITGRTISYLITNEDLINTFGCLNKNLNVGGILCFDFIDASQFIPEIKDGKQVIHDALVSSKLYRRCSNWQINYNDSWTFKWKSTFQEQNLNGDFVDIGSDDSVIRAFTKDDIAIFLKLSGFELIQVIDRKAYAFDTKVILAKKHEA